MIILHEYINGKREEDQIETWACLADIRKKYTVIDRELDMYDKNSYDDFIKEYWGKDDFINIEMDNVATLEQIDSLVNCPEPYCSYLYPCEYVFGREVPTDAFGCVKIAKSIQDQIPYQRWWRTGSWKTLDSRLKNQIAQVLPSKQVVAGVLKGMCYKIQGMPFPHNHNDRDHLLKHNHAHRLGEVDPVTGLRESPGVIEKEIGLTLTQADLFNIVVPQPK
jgi:hypothetical protein